MEENEQEKNEKDLNKEILENTKEYKKDKRKTNIVIYIFLCIVLAILLFIVGKCIFSFFGDSICCEDEERYQMIMGYSDKIENEYRILNTYEEYINFMEDFEKIDVKYTKVQLQEAAAV